MTTLFTVDVGTSSTKTALWDEDGANGRDGIVPLIR